MHGCEDGQQECEDIGDHLCEPLEVDGDGGEQGLDPQVGEAASGRP
jgi:hypothetical protein